MTLIRKFAIQGHSYPAGARSPMGPFPPEVLEKPRMKHEDNHADSLHEGLDNVRFYHCKECDAVLVDAELAEHICF